MKRFLLVDDEINVLNALQRILRQRLGDIDVKVETCSDPVEALARIGEMSFDLVISDQRMPMMTGVEFLKAVRKIQPDAVRLMLSAYSEFSAVVNAVNEAEVFRYIAKPWQPEDLEQVIRLALARREQILEDKRLADEMRVQRGAMSAQELEAKRLEDEEPGITKVNWGPDGSVHLE
ncbi:MAG: response regulator [Burkholderiales bacterium]|nr:response regulator [Burkholderiales bacterium]